ncbi:hypothetical protein RHCRD62_60215 [Rhodococcus sp. RD6.2]|nr:hypothetical protein RHCRD62_60215 [Rhodococcus sp. RD6.2]
MVGGADRRPDRGGQRRLVLPRRPPRRTVQTGVPEGGGPDAGQEPHPSRHVGTRPRRRGRSARRRRRGGIRAARHGRVPMGHPHRPRRQPVLRRRAAALKASL